MSTEGYNIASRLVKKGIEVSIVDERFQMAMQIKEEHIKEFESVSTLLGEEGTLIGVKPMHESISSSNLILFAPKIRKTVDEVKTDVSLKIREIGKYIRENCIFIMLLPQGLGDNLENISMIERMSGFKAGKDFSYVYMPITPTGKFLSLIGSFSPLNKKQLSIIQSIGVKGSVVNLELAEITYFAFLISNYSSMMLDFEMSRRAKYEERQKLKKILSSKNVYIDDLSSALYDAKLVTFSFKPNEPLAYVANGLIKGIELYVKYLVDEVKAFLKRNGLKASKTRVILAWSLDKYEIRGEKLALQAAIAEKLRDYVGEVSIYSIDKKKSLLPSPLGREDVILACSSKDYQHWVESKRTELIIKADAVLEAKGA
jgi:hypothetical protein